MGSAGGGGRELEDCCHVLMGNSILINAWMCYKSKKNICKRWHEKPKTTHGDKTVLYPCFHFTLVISKHLKAGKMINGLINFYNLS